jgi:hypothetical protein
MSRTVADRSFLKITQQIERVLKKYFTWFSTDIEIEPELVNT